MKVKVIKANLPTYWYAKNIGEVFEVVSAPSHSLNPGFVFKSTDVQTQRYFDLDDVEIVKEEKQMKKSDLRTGMRVVTADGWFGIVMNLEGKSVIVAERNYLFIDGMEPDLTCKGASDCNVMEVYDRPISPEHMLIPSARGCLLWKRETQTPEQKQLQEVMNKISELQDEAEKLQKLVQK